MCSARRSLRSPPAFKDVNSLFRRQLVFCSRMGNILDPLKERKMRTANKFSLLFVGLVLVQGAVAQEKKIKRSELPAAVEKTVAEQSKGATIRGFNQEQENGQTTYEAELIVNGHSKDVQMDANGTILEVEEQVDFQALPAEVQAGLQAKAGG